MGAANVREILLVPGSLIAAPTDLTTAHPHGGTELGLVRNIVLEFGFKGVPIPAVEWGTVSDVIYGGEDVLLSCVIRSFDDDMVTKIFPNTAEGSTSQHRLVTFFPGDNNKNRPGYLLSNKAFKLFFSPDSVDQHNGILLYNALPMLANTARMDLGRNREIGIDVVFQATPDGSGQSYAIGRRQDISLS